MASWSELARRWHRWLAWAVAIPVLLWTVTGLVMVARPISEVRGEGLLRPSPPLALAAPPRLPNLAGLPVTSLRLEQRASGPRWVARIQGVQGPRSADPVTGAWLAPLGASEAGREVLARYTGNERIASVIRVSRDKTLTELRGPVEGWRVALSDGTHFYVDSGSAEVIATRTRFWRFYDLMWGLHILDLKGRDNPHNPWVVTSSALAVAMVLFGLILLPLSIRFKRGRARPSAPSAKS